MTFGGRKIAVCPGPRAPTTCCGCECTTSRSNGVCA